MQKLPSKKVLTIIKLYLNGLSYSDIAAKVNIAKGTVSNVVAAFKDGGFPEAGGVPEQIEILRDLSADLKQHRMTAGQAAVGIAALSRLHELGLQPVDLERVAELHRFLPPEADMPGFVKAALALEDMRRRTGLDPEELEAKVVELEKAAAELEPLARQAHEQRQLVEELNKQRQRLSTEAKEKETRLKSLVSAVKEKEARELALAKHVSRLEQRAHDADERLAAARRDLQALDNIGLSVGDLTGFTHRLSGIAQRHTIKPEALRNRLLHELEQLEKGLSLESSIKEKKEKLVVTEQSLAEAQKELTAQKSAVETLRREHASLQAAIREERNTIRKEGRGIIQLAHDTVTRLKQDLEEGVNQALAEILELRDKALEVGNEIGRCQAIVEANNRLSELLAIVSGDGNVTGVQVRAAGLALLRGISAWLNQQPDMIGMLSQLKARVAATIEALEQWRP